MISKKIKGKSISQMTYATHPKFLVISFPQFLLSSPGSVLMLTVRQRHPTPVLLPGKSHGRRSLAEGQTRLSDFTFTSLSCIGEGNGKPLQCSCLENPRDGGAWWAAVYGVAQSRTRLKRLSSSSSTVLYHSTPCKLR